MNAKHFSPLGFPTEDWLTQSSAATLARRITSYWEQRGKYVSVWIEPMAIPNGAHPNTAYAIRSDMLGALPRGQG